MVSQHIHSCIATLAILPHIVILAGADIPITLMQAIIIIIITTHNLIDPPN
jgi:hypothetical protein